MKPLCLEERDGGGGTLSDMKESVLDHRVYHINLRPCCLMNTHESDFCNIYI